tara:strand:- start:1110 stop:1562 length:453 start_codon:yes stop_codon:yes gene_type:complete
MDNSVNLIFDTTIFITTAFFQLFLWFMNYPEDWPWLNDNFMKNFVEKDEYMYTSLIGSMLWILFLTVHLKYGGVCNKRLAILSIVIYALNIIMQTILIYRMYVKKYMKQDIKTFDDTNFGKYSKISMWILFCLNIIKNSVPLTLLLFYSS